MRKGDKVILTNARKGLNIDESYNGTILTFKEETINGIFTEETYPVYIKHGCYEKMK